MKTAVGIVGATLIFGSLVFFVMAFTLRNGPVGFIVISGAIMLVVGFCMDRYAEHKTCPQCSERIKNQARICHYCGHKFISASGL